MNIPNSSGGCDTCKFIHRTDSEDVSECHRYPPTVVIVQFNDERTGKLTTSSPTIYPIVFPDDVPAGWCGEYFYSGRLN